MENHLVFKIVPSWAGIATYFIGYEQHGNCFCDRVKGTEMVVCWLGVLDLLEFFSWVVTFGGLTENREFVGRRFEVWLGVGNLLAESINMKKIKI